MRCLPLDADAEVSGWLARKHTPEHVARVIDLYLARALPRDFRAPWARVRGRGWADAGYRLVAPFYDVTGELVALHARRVVRSDDGLPKTATPAGMTMKGRAMACPLARRMLAGEDYARALLVGIAERRSARHEGAALVIAEGLTDWLAWSTSYSDADHDAPAVLGIVAGSWTEALAARIPDGVTVCIATDDDESGDRYAAALIRTLSARVRSGALPPVIRHRGAAPAPEAYSREPDAPDDESDTLATYDDDEAEWWNALEADPM